VHGTETAQGTGMKMQAITQNLATVLDYCFHFTCVYFTDVHELLLSTTENVTFSLLSVRVCVRVQGNPKTCVRVWTDFCASTDSAANRRDRLTFEHPSS